MALIDRFLSSKKKPSEDKQAFDYDDSVLSTLEPESTQMASDTARVVAPSDDPAPASSASDGMMVLPLLGNRTLNQHRKTLSILLLVSILVAVVLTVLLVIQAQRASAQVAAAGQALVQSQRLISGASQAVAGRPEAFAVVRESSQVLVDNLTGLRDGGGQLGLSAVSRSVSPLLEEAIPLAEASANNARIVLAQEQVLTRFGSALRVINEQSSELLEIAETVASLKLQANAPASEIAATGQLVMLTQRLGRSANELLTPEGVSPQAAFNLGIDLNTFQEITQGLLAGSEVLRLRASTDPDVLQSLELLMQRFVQTQNEAESILGNLQSLVLANNAQDAIVNTGENLRASLDRLQVALTAQTRLAGVELALLVLAVLLAMLMVAGLVYLQLTDSRQRQLMAEQQRLAAEALEQEAKRINDANQAAILRLMNELQTVAQGDLTQEATVTEDITGAIADSVNYTVEELRSLVGQVQTIANRVTETTLVVENTSTELLAVSAEQLREIRDTGQSVLEMAQRINQVSGRAQESAEVARSSLRAAESGLKAVQDTIGGMNTIREQIQITAKRIKRLGESSQEIGEITELISDITEQTNVLGLNAAIQAASAGEAGRGFSVVAQEVQRLAERSAEATRQIAALVRTIQADTQDAVLSMERSTREVVEGAHLSDKAGAALSDIDRLSREVTILIEQIAQTATDEAAMASQTANSIQRIFAVTEQTGEGTRSTVKRVRELAKVAEELRRSVSRFRIA